MLSGELKKEYNKKYYSENKDKLKKANSDAWIKWRKENKDKIAKYNKKYYQNHQGIDTDLKKIKTIQEKYSVDIDTAVVLFTLIKKYSSLTVDKIIQEHSVDIQDTEYLEYLLRTFRPV